MRVFIGSFAQSLYVVGIVLDWEYNGEKDGAIPDFTDSRV